jgi:hypothetical protein
MKILSACHRASREIDVQRLFQQYPRYAVVGAPHGEWPLSALNHEGGVLG